MMAPEEILSSADASRRDFLKKVLAGTTFAAPVIASFSMEGLSPESAWAGPVAPNQCSNQTSSSSPCCRLAAEIIVRLARFSAAETANLEVEGVQLETLIVLFGPVGKAQWFLTEGLVKGDGECVNQVSRAKFRNAAKRLQRFKDLTAELCTGDLSLRLQAQADFFLSEIDDLLNCEAGPA
jgi:hypothetical protein